MKDESFGIIPVFKAEKGDFLFCIVWSSKGHWGFPKGHKDPGETDEETAKRELAEETGINSIDIINDFSSIEKFSFEKKGYLCNKTVKYFLGFTNSTKSSIPDNFKEEIPELRWVTYEEAKDMITFPERKIVLEEAHDYLIKYN